MQNIINYYAKIIRFKPKHNIFLLLTTQVGRHIMVLSGVDWLIVVFRENFGDLYNSCTNITYCNVKYQSDGGNMSHRHTLNKLRVKTNS